MRAGIGVRTPYIKEISIQYYLTYSLIQLALVSSEHLAARVELRLYRTNPKFKVRDSEGRDHRQVTSEKGRATGDEA